MSGFVALLAHRGARADTSLISRLGAPLDVLQPDQVAIHLAGPVALSQAFLSTRAGATPGPHTDGAGLWLVGDVRLDERDALVAALRGTRGADPALAAPPESTNDDLLVLAAYRAWGDAALGRLRGDFSFAIWDAPRGRLVCARDGLGVRPLFFAALESAFICSNSLTAVRAHPAVTRALHEPAVVSFLQWGFNVDTTTTTFADIRRLAPGHAIAVTVAGGAGRPWRHWRFPEPAPLRLRRDSDYVEQFRELLDAAVLDRLRGPTVSIQLSGGLDSPALAATIHRVSPSVAIKAYTFTARWAFDDQEGRLAANVAAGVRAEHVIYDDVFTPLEHLDDAAFRTPEPLDEFSIVPSRRLWADAAGHSRVMFIGEDGDALLRPPGLLTTLGQWPLRDVLTSYFRFVAIRRRLPHIGLWLQKRLRGVPIRWPGPPLPPWVRADAADRAGVQQMPIPLQHPSRPDMHELLTGPLWQCVQETDAFDYMRQPVEVRWPLLDQRLIEFAAAIPPVPWCQKKELLRVAFRDELPPEIIARPKTPFANDNLAEVAIWKKATLGRTWSLAPETVNFVDPRRFQATLQEASGDELAVGWRVLQLDQWLRTY